MGRILVDLVGNPGLSGLEDGAGNTFAPSNNRIVRNRFVADRILKDELPLFVIGQENRTGFCADLFQRKRFSELRTPNPEPRTSDVGSCFSRVSRFSRQSRAYRVFRTLLEHTHSGFSGIGGFPSFVGASSEGIVKEEQRGIKGHMYEKAH